MKLKISKISLALIFVWFVSVFCQQDTTNITIKNLQIHGNIQFSTKEIGRIIPDATYSPESLKALIESVLQKYQQKDFRFTTAETKDTSETFFLNIFEGLKLILTSINLTCSDSLLQNQLESLLDLRPLGSVDETILQNIELLLHFLENNGYPFGKILIDSLNLNLNFQPQKAALDIYLKVDPGSVVTLDFIHVSGNEITRNYVVIRETRLKTGAIYNHQQIQSVAERLQKTGYFKQVAQPVISLDEQGKGHLLIEVTEGNPNQLNAVFGYNPGSGVNKKSYITGLIDVRFRNLLGTGRIAEAFWQKKDQRSQELKFRYVEPWIRGYPINLGFGFQQIIQDTSFIRRNWGIDIDVPFSDILTIFSHVGRESILPDSIGQIIYGLPRSSSWLTKIGFSYDTRINRWNPTRGVFYATQYEYASKKVVSIPVTATDPDLKTGTFRRDRWTIDAEIYLPTFRWQTVLIGMHGRHVSSTENSISVADLYRFGGTGSLRGYREDEFWGDKIAWLNLEYRYLLADRSRVFLFSDGGYFTRNDAGKITDDYKFSYGFGIRIETRLGIIGIDYGLGEGRGLTSGLVHVGLTNQF